MEKNPLKFLGYYLKYFRWYFIVTTLFVFLSTIGGRMSVYYTAQLFDLVAGGQGLPDYWHQLVGAGVLVFSYALLRVIAFELTIYLNAKYYPKVETMVIRNAFDHTNRHSIAFFTQEMSGNLAAKISQLANGVKGIMRQYHNTLSTILLITITLIMLSLVSWVFFFGVIIWTFVMLAMGIYFGRKRIFFSKSYNDTRSKARGVIVDSLSNYSDIKSFSNFKFERLNLSRSLKKSRVAETNDKMFVFKFHFTQNMTVLLSIIIFAVISFVLLYHKQITTADFILVNTLFPSLSRAVFDISYTYNELAENYGMMVSSLRTLSVDPEIIDKKEAVTLKADQIKIDWENVGFSYPEHYQLFKDLNVQIKAGEKVGLVGLSGSGKSTFIKLIARYYDIDSGAIKINGIDIRDLTQDSLRQHISTIPQDVNLFNRSLLENIRYGKTHASENEVIKAAKKAYAHDFIASFPKGYETIVGERGVVLSGGERQRIAIARAILKDAPLLIFDEATSALDSNSEQHIQKSLQELMRGKTVIAIAHRLSTLREMDRILVFEKGSIVEQGSHLSLLRKKGVYYKLYNLQADGFINAASTL